MLSQLYIRNIAVISEATIDLSDGFNVFTGETGAGKSMLIGAINAVLGERTSRELVRTGETQAVVSALFTGLSPAAVSALDAAGFSWDEEDGLLITRELSADGKSACRIGGRPATAAILRGLAPLLVNIHGQHDGQQLLSAPRHLAFIDSFGQTHELMARYAGAYQRYMALKREREALEMDEAEKARRLDLLRFQVGEIDDAAPDADEEETMRARRKLIQNALRVTTALGGSIALLDGDEDHDGLSGRFSALAGQMRDAAACFEQARPVSERLDELFYELEGLSGEIRRLLGDFDCDPRELDGIESRLDVYYRLKKKYGPALADVLAFRERAAAEMDGIERADERAEKLDAQAAQALAQARALAEELSARRSAAAETFAQEVCAQLASLDMPGVRLHVRREEKPMSADGIDAVELMISANAGEAERSLSKVASGGELSRIMLSIKSVMAGRDDAGTMIFDEVDAGVSGRAAQKIGRKLAQAARERQVLAVTHLAQVACYAGRHLFISKTSRDGRVFTEIVPLDEVARARELARITAGEHVTELAVSHACEMLASARADLEEAGKPPLPGPRKRGGRL